MLATPKPVSVEDNGKLVVLYFHHALSSVTFKIKKEYPTDPVPITIGGLEVQGLKKSGKATIDNAGSITWSDVTGNNTYSYTGGLSAPLTVPKEDIAPMLLLPQSLNADTKVVLRISDGYDPSPRDLTASLKTASIEKWEAGKAYTYTLTIKGHTLLDIALEITDWTDIKINVTM